MYSPERNQQPQDGGLYISTVMDPSSFIIDGISRSTLSTILYLAQLSSYNISTFSQITQLSIDQINNLIQAVQLQIGKENDMIIANQAEIARLSRTITDTGGLQEIYDTTYQQYVSVQTQYNLAIEQQTNDLTSLNNMIVQMQGLSSLSTFYGSSIIGYQLVYSSIYNQIYADQSTINSLEAIYQSNLARWSVDNANYLVTSTNLVSSQYALALNSSFLSTATFLYLSTSSVYATDIVQFNQLSTIVSSLQSIYNDARAYVDYLNSLSSQQIGYLISTQNALKLASTSMMAAQATVNYDQALSAELSSIMEYNILYNTIVHIKRFAPYIPFRTQLPDVLMPSQDIKTTQTIWYAPSITGDITLTYDDKQSITATGIASINTVPMFGPTLSGPTFSNFTGPFKISITISPGAVAANLYTNRITLSNNTRSKNLSIIINSQGSITIATSIPTGSPSEFGEMRFSQTLLEPSSGSNPIMIAMPPSTVGTNLLFDFDVNYMINSIQITSGQLTTTYTNIDIFTTDPSQLQATLNLNGTTNTDTYSVVWLPTMPASQQVMFGGSLGIDDTMGEETFDETMEGGQLTVPGTTSTALGTTSTAQIVLAYKILVAGGAGGNTLAWTSDGKTWTAGTATGGGNTTTIFSTQCNAVANDPTTGMWVAGGEGTNTLASSADGKIWTGLGNIMFTSKCYGVTWGNPQGLGIWVAVGDGNYVAWSNNGINWTRSSLLPTTYYCVHYDSRTKIFIAGGQETVAQSTSSVTQPTGLNILMQSTDGKAWTAIPPERIFIAGNKVVTIIPRVIYAISSSPTTIIAVGSSGALSSGDGNWWMIANSPTTLDYNGQCVAWGNNKWILGGGDPKSTTGQFALFTANPGGFSLNNLGGKISNGMAAVTSIGTTWVYGFSGSGVSGKQRIAWANDIFLPATNTTGLTWNIIPDTSPTIFSSTCTCLTVGGRMDLTTSTAPGTSSTAPGTTSRAPGTTSTAPGTTSRAPGTTSTAPGTTSTAPGTTSTAPGTTSTRPGTISIVINPETTSTAPETTSTGTGAVTIQEGTGTGTTQTIPAGVFPGVNIPSNITEEYIYNLSTQFANASVAMWKATIDRQTKATIASTMEAITFKTTIDIADYNIYASQLALLEQQNILASTISSMSTLSTQIAYNYLMLEYDYSTLRYYSSLEYYDRSTINFLSTAILGYDNIERTLSSFYRSTLFTIAFLMSQSTMFNSSIAFYRGQYSTYAYLEELAQVSVNTLSTSIGTNNSSILGYEGQSQSLGSQITSEFQQLNSFANQFYMQKQSYLNNELDEYKYAVQEWNSFTGLVTSDLLIYKLNLYTLIDSITFDLQRNLTTEQVTANTTARNEAITKQTNIQRIIDALNPLDTPFLDIVRNIESERTNKIIFINTRSTLTAYEIMVLQNSTLLNTVQSDYIAKLTNLQATVQQINSQVSTRDTNFNSIKTVIQTNQWPVIQSMNLLPSLGLPRLPSDTTLAPFSNSKNDYVLLSTLNYPIDPNNYLLVLANP